MDKIKMVTLSAEQVEEIVINAVSKANKRKRRIYIDELLARLEYVTTSQAATLTGRTEQTVKQWTKKGRIKRYKTGKTECYRLEDVLNLAADLEDQKAGF